MATKFKPYLSKDESECCGCCMHFHDEGVYGDGECFKHPEICTYQERVCDDFELKKYYGDDESRAE